jgi:CDP-diglyceride synthetase
VGSQTSKAAKIWRRTGVGLSLGAVAITFLVLGTKSVDGAVIAVGATPLALAAAWEVSRMGRLGGKGLAFVLLAPVLCSIFLCWEFVRHAAVHKVVERSAVHANLLAEAGVVVVLALLGWSVVRFMSTNSMWSHMYRAGVAVALALSSYVVASSFYDVSRETRTVAILVGLIGLGAVANTLAGAARAPRRELLWALGLSLWIALPLTWLWHVWDRFGGGGLVALVVLSKVGDIFAYYGGNAFGKHHPFPKLSPGKTVEGFACSVAAGLLTGGILAATPAIDAGIGAGVLAGLVVNVAAQAGDLLESWVKRTVGVKDSSNVFGPSGGILDVVDSLLLTSPAALLAWPWLFQASGV